MPRHRLYLIAVLALILVSATLGYCSRDVEISVPAVAPHSYGKALRQAHDGLPGAARVLYQQLQRGDLTPIESIRRLLPAGQRSLVLGPMLDDDEQSVRFAAVDALLGLDADAIGLYFGPLQQALEAYQQALLEQPEDSAAQVHLARLYLHEDDYAHAALALQRSLQLSPQNLDALAVQVRLLERQGLHDESRQVLAKALALQPDSAFLQHDLGLWLNRHQQTEYALLAFARAVELEPENTDYRYMLAVTLHQLEQVEAAQKQLQTILDRQPASRNARLLLIQYWKETGQLQNVQVLLAELERQNPDDPILQQGL